MDINTVCEECAKKTGISYRYDGSFFTPKLLTINHLQLGNSKLLRNPIVLFLEWLYLQYKHLRNWVQKVMKRLFPRRAKLWCNRVDSYLVGSVHYAQRHELHVPIHNLRIEFWGRTRWLQWRLLSEGYTNYDGSFSLPFELRQARNWKMYKAQFEIYETTHVYFKKETPRLHFERCYLQSVPLKNLTGMRYNLRTIHLHLWEYRTDANVPRTEITDVESQSPQYYSNGRKDAMIQQVVPLEMIKIKHLEQIAYAPETISLSDIQSDYAENLTLCIERKLPGYTRGDEWFGKRMMNGMNRGAFLPDKEEPGMYWIKYFGVCNYEHNNEYALPTVAIKFRIENSFPQPLQIHLTGPTNAFNKCPWQKKVFAFTDGEEWLYAKRIARVGGGFSTEVDEHFTGTHLNTEQYAIAAYRNFRKNPLACLLFPHLKEVALINHSADKVIIHSYIPSATALTEKGIHDRTRDLLGMQDWKNWQPMRVLCEEQHTCAKAEQLFWQVVVEYVDDFFTENLAEITQHWREIYHFSQDLVEHAVPQFLSDIDLNLLSPRERKLAEERFEYYAYQYSFDIKAKREVVNGELKAVSPITQSLTYEEAQPEDLQNIKQVCYYAIMMATYMHTWINEHQYDDMGEVLYNCGGLRFGDKERGILAPESDLSIAPDLTRSTQMLWLTNFLSRTEYGFITRNEEGDVNPAFCERLLEKEEEFAHLGVNVHAIESRTNI